MTAHLQDGDRKRFAADAPGIQLGEVGDAPRRDAATAVRVARVLHRLDELLAADRLLAEVAEKVPQQVLQRDLEGVRLEAEPLCHERVVRVVDLLLREAEIRDRQSGRAWQQDTQKGEPTLPQHWRITRAISRCCTSDKPSWSSLSQAST